MKLGYKDRGRPYLQQSCTVEKRRQGKSQELMPGWRRPGRQTTLLVMPASLLGACPPLGSISVTSSGITQPSSPENQCPRISSTLTTQATGRERYVCVGMDSRGGSQPGQFCKFPAQDPGPGRPPGAGQALRLPGRAQGDGIVPSVKASQGHRGSSCL